MNVIIKLKILVGIIPLLISSNGFSKGAAFQDSYSNLRSNAQVYQYGRNYIEGYYSKTDIKSESETKDSAGNVVSPKTEFTVDLGPKMGAVFILNLKNSMWFGLDVNQSTWERDIAPDEGEVSVQRIRPFAAFHIGNALVLSAGLEMQTNKDTYKDAVDSSFNYDVENAPMIYDVGVLYHGNTFEVGFDYKTGALKEDDPLDASDMAYDIAPELTVHGRALFGGFEVGGFYLLTQDSSADLGTTNTDEDYTNMGIHGKIKGILFGYKKEEIFEHEIYKARFNDVDSQQTIFAGYDGAVKNFQLGAIYELNMISDENTDAVSGDVDTSEGTYTTMKFSLGFNF